MQVLEILARCSWSGLDVVAASEPRGMTAVVTDGLRIVADREVLIDARSVDLIPKLEVFQPQAVTSESVGPDRAWSTPRNFEGLGDLLAPFVGRGHQILVGARRYEVPEWARPLVTELVIEDVLLVRSPGGQMLVIGPDDHRPLAVVVGSDWDDLPDADAKIEHLRPI